MTRRDLTGAALEEMVRKYEFAPFRAALAGAWGAAYRDAMEEAKREATQLRGVLARIAAIRLDGEPGELGEVVSMDIGDAFRILSQVVTDAREVTR